MDIVEALLGEHGVFYAQFDEVERLLPGARAATDVHALARVVGGALIAHAHIENRTLFERLKHAIGEDGPIGVMYAEHEAIDHSLQTAQGTSDLGHARHALSGAIGTARDHFAKEEHIVFPLARQVVDRKELEEMAFRWSDERGVRLP